MKSSGEQCAGTGLHCGNIDYWSMETMPNGLCVGDVAIIQKANECMASTSREDRKVLLGHRTERDPREILQDA